MTPQLFLDLDGVLADFDGHYEKLFGERPNQDTYEPFNLWDNIRNNKTFYRDLPFMPDAIELWNGVSNLHITPIILTGIPYSIPNVKQQKQEWVWEHFGYSVQVICCRSIDKWRHMKHIGDILVDDRLKYSDRWLDKGGVFVLHKKSISTLMELHKLYHGIRRHY